MLNKHEKATIAYFDQFDFPLTEAELKRWSFSEFVLDSVGVGLNKSSSCGRSLDMPSIRIEIESKQGFYFLKGREEIVEIRKQRYIIADQKFQRALKFAKLFRLLPSVRMIAVCNSLAFSNARTTSDIDFFIVTRPGMIWLTRFWLQAFLRLFRLRPHDHGVSIEDAICLSFFTTSDNLDFNNLQITKPDIYLALWLSQLITVYDPDNIYNEIWQRNTWIKDILPEAQAYNLAPQRRIVYTAWSKVFIPLTCDFLEKTLKKIQKKLLPDSLRTMANQDVRVVVNDKMLKFHSNDRREEMYNKWRKKLNN